MPKASKFQRRNLNEAFIALSDDEEYKPSDESISSDTASSSVGKAKTATPCDKTKKIYKLSSNKYSSNNTDYIARNFILKSPFYLHEKSNKSQSTLKRSENLSSSNISQNKSKKVRVKETRRSLEINIPPLADISNIETEMGSRTLIRSKLQNVSQHAHSNEKELKENTIKSKTLKSRISYPGCKKRLNQQRQNNKGWNIISKNADVKVPANFTQSCLQTGRNLVGWERVGHNIKTPFTNPKQAVQPDRQALIILRPENNSEESNCFKICTEAATNDIEGNMNSQFAYSSTNSSTDLHYCILAPRIPKVLNMDTEPSETKEIRLQYNSLEIPSCSHTRTEQILNSKKWGGHVNLSENLLGTVGNNKDFLHPYLKTKQMYYERRKVDLDEIERETRKVLTVKLISAFEIKIPGKVKSAYNIEGNDKSQQQRNSDSLKTGNLLENQQAKNTSESASINGSPNHQIKEYSEVKTPESPITALINKNLSEFSISKIINR